MVQWKTRIGTHQIQLRFNCSFIYIYFFSQLSAFLCLVKWSVKFRFDIWSNWAQTQTQIIFFISLLCFAHLACVDRLNGTSRRPYDFMIKTKIKTKYKRINILVWPSGPTWTIALLISMMRVIHFREYCLNSFECIHKQQFFWQCIWYVNNV